MGQLSAVLRNAVDNGLLFWCPGCNEAHEIKHGEGPGPRWGWNGNAERPTFTPSILVRSGHHAPHYRADRDSCWCTFDAEEIARGQPPSGFKCTICHSFVADGRIQFLSDCTHALTGQTVDLPPWPGRPGPISP